MQDLSESRKRSKSIFTHTCTQKEYFDIMQKFCYLFGEMIEGLDAVCAIETGGIIPASMIADIYNKPCYSIQKDNTINYIPPSLYEKNILDPFSLSDGEWKITIPKEYKNIALIDDVIDTGKEVERAEQILRDMGKEYYIYTLIIKPWNSFSCRGAHNVYFVEQIPAWMIWPWEKK